MMRSYKNAYQFESPAKLSICRKTWRKLRIAGQYCFYVFLYDFMEPSSIGQDTRFSSLEAGFDSPWLFQFWGRSGKMYETSPAMLKRHGNVPTINLGDVGKLVTPADCKSAARKALLVRLQWSPPRICTVSSVGQIACLSRKRPGVRVPYGAPNIWT